MTDKEFTLDTMRRYGRQRAQEIQGTSSSMTNTELNEQDGYIPDFVEAKAKMNMMERHAGMTDGFVCKSSASRVVRLVQNYDSETYPGEPEELDAQWGFVWSQNPGKAKPFLALATSPYMEGDCCSVVKTDESGEQEVVEIYRSNMDNNVHSPLEYPQGWELVVM